MKTSQKFVLVGVALCAIASTFIGTKADAFSLNYLGKATNDPNQYDYDLIVGSGESLPENSEIILIGTSAIASEGILSSGQNFLTPAGSFSITPDSSIALIDVSEDLTPGSYGFDLTSSSNVNNGLEFFISNSSTEQLTDGSPTNASSSIQTVSEPPTTLGLIAVGIAGIFLKVHRKKVA